MDRLYNSNNKLSTSRRRYRPARTLVAATVAGSRSTHSLHISRMGGVISYYTDTCIDLQQPSTKVTHPFTYLHTGYRKVLSGRRFFCTPAGHISAQDAILPGQTANSVMRAAHACNNPRQAPGNPCAACATFAETSTTLAQLAQPSPRPRQPLRSLRKPSPRPRPPLRSLRNLRRDLDRPCAACANLRRDLDSPCAALHYSQKQTIKHIL
jgi:hypothetical protein